MLPVAVAQLASADVDVAEIERRVREVYFEGFPFEASRDLSPAAVDRLAEMLESEADRRYWSNIVLALGGSQSRRAYAPLAAFADRTPSAEVDSDLYQARMALPVALGHLARSDADALALVARMARSRSDEPGWSFRALRGRSLADLLQRRAVTGLAVSGRPEARAVLDELRDAAPPRGGDSTEFDRNLDAAQTLCDRVEREGADRVFGRAARERAGRR